MDFAFRKHFIIQFIENYELFAQRTISFFTNKFFGPIPLNYKFFKIEIISIKVHLSLLLSSSLDEWGRIYMNLSFCLQKGLTEWKNLHENDDQN